jgi:alkyl sulfatase BDS1-like metallo-beta-lactamase superfamily hydrolase
MAVEPKQLLRNLGVRLKAECCLAIHQTLTLELTDRQMFAALEIRQGVLQITLNSSVFEGNSTTIHLRTTWSIWVLQMALGWPDMKALLEQGEIELLKGQSLELFAFLDCFELPLEYMPRLATR